MKREVSSTFRLGPPLASRMQASRDSELYPVPLCVRIAHAGAWAGAYVLSPHCFAKAACSDSALRRLAFWPGPHAVWHDGCGGSVCIKCSQLHRGSRAIDGPCRVWGGPRPAPRRCLLCPPSVHTVQLAGGAVAPLLSAPASCLWGWWARVWQYQVSCHSIKRYVPFAVPSTCHVPYSRVLLHSLGHCGLSGGAIAQTGLAMTLLWP